MNDHYRKTKPAAPLDEVPESIAAVSGGQDAVDDRDLIMRLLGVLSSDERELVLMKYRDGKRNVDIARELTMNASTVSTRLAAALAKMRAALEKGM